MVQVFVSYSNHSEDDIKFVEKLTSDLRDNGITIWMAPRSIAPGKRWIAEIEEGMSASSHLILILSPDAINARGVKFEMDMAIPLEWEGKIQIIPVEYRQCELPRSWRIYQAIKDFPAAYERNFQRLLEQIEPSVSPQTIELQSLSDEKLDELLVQGIRALLAGTGANTKRTYAQHLKRFMDWRYTQERIGLVEQLRQYIEHMQSEKKSPNTIVTRVNVIKRMLRTTAKLDGRLALDALIASDLEIPEAHNIRPRIRLSSSQLQVLLTAPQTSTIGGWRDKCILELMILAGLRRSEIADLTWENLVCNNDSYELVGLSSGRTVKISNALAQHMLEWGARANRDISDSRKPIFCRVTKEDRVVRPDSGITAHAIYKLLNKYTNLSGLPQIHPDALRQHSSDIGDG